MAPKQIALLFGRFFLLIPISVARLGLIFCIFSLCLIFTGLTILPVAWIITGNSDFSAKICYHLTLIFTFLALLWAAFYGGGKDDRLLSGDTVINVSVVFVLVIHYLAIVAVVSVGPWQIIEFCTSNRLLAFLYLYIALLFLDLCYVLFFPINLLLFLPDDLQYYLYKGKRKGSNSIRSQKLIKQLSENQLGEDEENLSITERLDRVLSENQE